MRKIIDAFCFPNGSLSEREIVFAGKEYKYAFTTEQTYPTIGGNLLAIPRIAQSDDYWCNLAKIAGTWNWLKR